METCRGQGGREKLASELQCSYNQGLSWSHQEFENGDGPSELSQTEEQGLGVCIPTSASCWPQAHPGEGV